MSGVASQIFTDAALWEQAAGTALPTIRSVKGLLPTSFQDAAGGQGTGDQAAADGDQAAAAGGTGTGIGGFVFTTVSSSTITDLG